MPVISFDLWGTLIKPSPTFSEEKIKLVHSFVRGNLPEGKINHAFNSAKQKLNAVIEGTGYQPPEKVIFQLLFTELNWGGYYEYQRMPEFIKKYQELAINNPPVLYEEATLSVIHELQKKHILVISSNTMFLRGETMKEILSIVGLKKYFSSFYFSDEKQIAKPNVKAYNHTAAYHIGDNFVTDDIGAVLAGIKPIIINSNSKTIKDAFNEIVNSN